MTDRTVEVVSCRQQRRDGERNGGCHGKPSELIEVESVLKDGIPVVKRFSGGGTVIVDSGTIFMSFICNKGDIPGLQPYPSPIMSWTGQLYGQILSGVGDFCLRENDYAFGSRKVGGNAQSITKDRWIHHTSFLWDYDVKNMEYLKLPSRAPKYRSTSTPYKLQENRKNEERKRGKEWITPYQHKYAITITPPKSDLQKWLSDFQHLESSSTNPSAN
ncbi:hypothetical protein QJS04_geneDACA000802 [Acorus gramineus]|uniref:BPL/LPL catalytic domain-containing protein n=1 Tax=Acorus gramineus TaxID=55184 RepID=A0AAV9BE80_ACOGR|nr:hypothetical protein QJS04_geneDACA000802 [Acorus gramineus]